MTELEVAELVARGELPPAYRFANSWYVPMRISGTGAAYRASLGEFVWREPHVWLSPLMQRRVLGLPLVAEHPPADTLDSAEFYTRILGILVYAFVRDESLWGVARLFDGELAAGLVRWAGEYTADTSPGVAFATGETQKITLDSGDVLVVENTPALLDHLAVVVTAPGQPGGVWSKGDIGNVGIVEQEIAHAA